MLGYYTNIYSSEVCAKHVIPFVITLNIVGQSLIGFILLVRAWAMYQRESPMIPFLLAVVLLFELIIGAVNRIHRDVIMISTNHL